MDRDNELVSKALAGDYEAFEALVQKHQGPLYRHLRKMVKDYSLAEDLLQETFLQRASRIGPIRGKFFLCHLDLQNSPQCSPDVLQKTQA